MPREEAIQTPPTDTTDAPEDKEADMLRALRRVKDPDLQLNIVDLGLVYGYHSEESNAVVNMTLTSPGCPAGPEITSDVERELKTIPWVEAVQVNIIWTPYWTPDRINPRVRSSLGFF